MRTIVKPQHSGSRMVRDAFRRHRGLSVLDHFGSSAVTEDDWADRMAGADQVVHFFADGPIPANSILRARPRQITIVGPVGNCVDMAAIEGSGTRVVGWSGLTVNAVAEFTIALMFYLARLLPAGREQQDGSPFFGTELRGSILGIVGFGRIGRAVAELGVGLGMTVLAASPTLTAEEASARAVTLASLPEIAAQSSVVSVHARATPQNANLLDVGFFRLMRADAMLINTARPALVDLDALRSTLRAGALSGVALDMPPDFLPEGDELLVSPRVLITPHAAWMTPQAMDSMLEHAWLEVARDLT